MITEQTPTPQNTLYSRFGNAPRFGDISVMATHARAVGYPYFEWNGRVYKIDYENECLFPASYVPHFDIDVVHQTMIEEFSK